MLRPDRNVRKKCSGSSRRRSGAKTNLDDFDVVAVTSSVERGVIIRISGMDETRIRGHKFLKQLKLVLLGSPQGLLFRVVVPFVRGKSSISYRCAGSSTVDIRKFFRELKLTHDFSIVLVGILGSPHLAFFHPLGKTALPELRDFVFFPNDRTCGLPGCQHVSSFPSD